MIQTLQARREEQHSISRFVVLREGRALVKEWKDEGHDEGTMGTVQSSPISNESYPALRQVRCSLHAEEVGCPPPLRGNAPRGPFKVLAWIVNNTP